MKIEFSEQVTLPTAHGIYDCFAVKELVSGKEHLVLLKGDIDNNECTVRMHSSCVTGDIFKSLKCDCHEQLHAFLGLSQKHNNVVLIYLDQEGRGIGLFNKINAYKLQENGLNTVEANLALGFKIDEREYAAAAEILKKLNPSKINLVTNNPEKLDQLRGLTNIPISRIEVKILATAFNKDYLSTKIKHMNHLIEANI